MKIRKKQPNKKNSQSEEAKQSIRIAIASGKLRPNQRIIEMEIAEALGMSRTPVREALRQLESQGYLTRLPKRGLIVKENSPDDVRNLFEIREALESMAAKLACQRANPENISRMQKYHTLCNEAILKRDIKRFIKANWAFHDELLDASGNRVMASYVRSNRDKFFPLLVLQLFQDAEWQATIQEHSQILEAVIQRDQRKAEKATQKHIKMSAGLITRRS